MTISATTARDRHPFFVLSAGAVLAATLDIVYACVFWAVKSDVPPLRIFQSVAAGLLGDASFKGGTATAALGLLLHYAIMFAMATTYYAAARRVSLLRERPWVHGALYGLLLYGVMQYAVVPLSRAAGGPNDPLWIALSIVVHAAWVGIPIALFARAALRSSH